MVEVGETPVRPRVPRYFYVVPMSGHRIQMRSAHKTVILSGNAVKSVERLLKLSDGTRDLAQIVAEFPDIPEEEVLRTIRKLRDKGLIEDAEQKARDLRREAEGGAAENADREDQTTFFSMICRDGRIAQDLLRNSHVVVFDLGRVGSHAAVFLTRAGIGKITVIDDEAVDRSQVWSSGTYLPGDLGRLRSEVIRERLTQMDSDVKVEVASVSVNDVREVAGVLRGANLALVCADSPAVSIYRTVNAAALQENVRWLRASLEGFEAQLGPCVLPRETACYTCYELRVKGNWSNYDENLAFEEYLCTADAGGVDFGCLAPTSGLLGSLAALECLKLLTGFSYPMTCGKLWRFNMNTFEARAHEVLKLPRCPSCGLTAHSPAEAQWAL